jgi:formamidopyrimidine-DNA glycosylase
LLLEFESVQFAVHLMQGGRLLSDAKQSAKPRGGQARFVFEGDGPALLLTEAGTERRAGVWCLPAATALTSPPLDKLGPEADQVTPEQMLVLLAAKNQRVHGFLRDQRAIAGLGRRLANEICHRARLSPFAMTRRLGPDGATKLVTAIEDTITEGLRYERSRLDMSSSKDRPSGVHKRTGEPCQVCSDAIRAVEYSGYTVHYCATCQTGGKVLADNTTSKFLK